MQKLNSESHTTPNSFIVKEQVVSAEIKWALKSVYNRFSFRSCAEISDLFKSMFTDSDIAQSFSMGSTKLSYIVSFGLAPHFLQQLKLDVKKCDFFTICFDEALNKVAQRCQMDLFVRFFGPAGVHTRFE